MSRLGASPGSCRKKPWLAPKRLIGSALILSWNAALAPCGSLEAVNFSPNLELLKVRKTAKDAKSAKERKIRNKRFYRLSFFFLGDLGALGGSKKDFAILLDHYPDLWLNNRSGLRFCYRFLAKSA